MAERKVLLGSHLYYDEKGTQREAVQGTILDLSDEEIERGEALEAIGPVDAELPSNDQSAAIAALDDGNLEQWVSTSNVKTVLDAATDVPTAQRLLQAEVDAAEAADREPRKGIVDGLAAIAATE